MNKLPRPDGLDYKEKADRLQSYSNDFQVSLS